MQRSKHSRAASGKLRWLIVGLIACSTVLFITGVAIEKSSSAVAASNLQQEAQPTANSEDADGGHEGSSPAQQNSAGATQAAQPAETVLGLDIEAPWFLVAFVLGWLILAGALFRFGRPALVALLLVALSALLLDGAEVIHQTSEAKAILVTLAVLVALAHLLSAALAALALRPKRGKPARAAR